MLMKKDTYQIMRAKRPGVTSLLFVLAIGLVLVVMVAGIAALTIREQQQSSNTELSSRALQTAEAGVKAAVQKLEADPGYSKATCADTGNEFTNLSTESGTNQSITCITVNNAYTGRYEGQIDVDNTQDFYTGPSIISGLTSGLKYLRLRWNNTSLGDPTAVNYAGNLYPAYDNYTNPAFIELSLIYWRKDNPVSNPFRVQTFILAPVQTAGLGNTRDGVESVCSATNPSAYKCGTVDFTSGGITYNGFNVGTALGLTDAELNQHNFAIRVQPRYKGTHIQVEASNASNTAINFTSNYAQIDVTAKAGNLYRRVKALRPNRNAALSDVLTSAIFSGAGPDNNANRNICKNFAVKASGANYVVAEGEPDCNNLIP